MRFVPWILVLVLVGCTEQRVELFGGCDGCAPTRDAGAAPLSLRDPERCGVEETHCEDDEYCVDGSCVCRQGMVRIGEECVDTSADGDHCGLAGVDCPALCEAGACVSSCSAGTACEGGCVDRSTHPLHCGECGRPCGANQVCVRGLCTPFEPVADCAECSGTCCSYPTRPSDLICVDGDSC
jgi:hypothetical protein